MNWKAVAGGLGVSAVFFVVLVTTIGSSHDTHVTSEEAHVTPDQSYTTLPLMDDRLHRSLGGFRGRTTPEEATYYVLVKPPDASSAARGVQHTMERTTAIGNEVLKELMRDNGLDVKDVHAASKDKLVVTVRNPGGRDMIQLLQGMPDCQYAEKKPMYHTMNTAV